MITISSRKFRDNQNEILRSALEEEVILKTIHYGCFRLVPIREGEEHFVRPHVDVPAYVEKKQTALTKAVEAPVAAAPEEEKVSVAPVPEPVAPTVEEKPVEVPAEPAVAQAPAPDTNVKDTVLETASKPAPTQAQIRKRNPHSSQYSYSFSGSRPAAPSRSPFAVEHVKTEEAKQKPAAPSVFEQEIELETKAVEEAVEPKPAPIPAPMPAPQPVFEAPEPVQAVPQPAVEEKSEPIEEPQPKEVLEEEKPKALPTKPVSTREVFVDPSLLSIDELLAQEGFEPLTKKKGLFNKIFKK